MHPARFEPVIPAGERLQTHGLDRSTTGVGGLWTLEILKLLSYNYLHTPPPSPHRFIRFFFAFLYQAEWIKP
jgi:hypothetical protein